MKPWTAGTKLRVARKLLGSLRGDVVGQFQRDAIIVALEALWRLQAPLDKQPARSVSPVLAKDEAKYQRALQTTVKKLLFPIDSVATRGTVELPEVRAGRVIARRDERTGQIEVHYACPLRWLTENRKAVKDSFQPDQAKA